MFIMKLMIAFIVLITNYLVLTSSKIIPSLQYLKPLQATQLNNGNNIRIANGSPAEQNQFPYQVSILIPEDFFFLLCGGSLISPNWVLTAAYCIKSYKQFDLRFGSIHLLNGGISMTSFFAIKHEMYNEHELSYNIGLIRTPRAVDFSMSTNAIQLPRMHEDIMTDGMKTILSGWGIDETGELSEELKWVYMKIIRNTECINMYGDMIVDHVVCAVGYENPSNQGGCPGDSGGPLAISDSKENTLVGIVSFVSSTGCDSGYPMGFIRASHFIHWIYSKTNISVHE